MGDIHTSTLSLSKKVRLTGILIFLAAVIFINGCHKPDLPKFRIGSFFGSPGGMSFTDPNNLGKHSGNGQKRNGEKTGMVYTCKGGFIDLGHLREGVDRTAHLAKLTKKNLTEGKTNSTSRL